MYSSSFSSNNYGTINDANDYTQLSNKNNKSKTSWKSLTIGLFLSIIIIATFASIYYYGGFDSFFNKINGVNGSNSIHGVGSNSGIMIKNVIDSESISAKYYEAMSQRRSQGGVNSHDSCDSLREQLNEETQERTNEFVRYYSNELNDYLYTVYPDEVDNAGASYAVDGSAGYLWAGELPGVTEPLYRYINENCNGNDHFYSTKLANYGSSNWQQISGFIMSESCSFNTPLYEYYSESECNHYYTINQNEIENKNSEFEFQRIVGYVAKE